MKQVRLVILLIVISLTTEITFGQAIRWTTDGTGYYRIESGEIVQYSLPGNAKTVIVSKAQLTPAGTEKAIPVRNFTFSVDGNKALIYTNTKKVWRLDTRGDYWVFDKTSNSIKQIGKGKPASSLMFAKFSPDATKVAYVCEYNLYVEDLASGEIKALTTDGNRKFINGWLCRWIHSKIYVGNSDH